MLPYLPTLYPNELLYSWFARYDLYSMNDSFKQTMEDLFNNRNAVAVLDLPINLTEFYENIKRFNPPSISSLIKNNTFYKYYTFFQGHKVKEKVMNSMLNGDNPGGIHLSLGVVTSSVKEWTYIRYCPKCIEQDKKTYGEAYWHLDHQLPKVFYCLIHEDVLHNSKLKARTPQKHRYFTISDDVLQSERSLMSFSQKEERHLKRLSKECITLIDSPLKVETIELQQIYRYLLQVNGYANHSGKVNQRKLTEQFLLFYGEEVLSLLESEVYFENDSCWLKAITRKHRKGFHPIRHILFLNFFGVRIKDLESLKGKVYQPFGEAPHYCLNPTADHFMKRVVGEVVISRCYDTGKPVGTFKCTCGFVYSRRGPDNSEEDQFKIGRIKEFGPVWKKRLKKLLYEEGLTYNAAATKLKCDPVTVKRYFQYLLEGENKVETNAELKMKEEVVLAKEKKWLKLVEENKDLSVTELRNRDKALYSWLYRNHQEWLKKNSPKKLKSSPVKNRVDWFKRDVELLNEVVKMVKYLYNQEKPVFVNKSRVGKTVGKLSLIEKNLNKLPKTKLFLESHIESREDYQIRLLKWACKEVYKQDREFVRRWRVIGHAGIRDNISERAEKALQKEIEIYNKL